MKIKFRKNVKKLINILGYGLIRIDASTDSRLVLPEMANLIPKISTVIDIGASDGRWSLEYERYFKESKFLLFEAAKFHFQDLNVIANRKNYFVEYLAASNKTGEVAFHMDKNNPLGGGANSSKTHNHSEMVPCTTIDISVKKYELEGPFVLKLDAQGHEVEILEGAAEVLKETELLIIEVYTIDEPGRLTFDQICSVVGDYGFRAAGIMDILKRPCDNIWWQADFVFLKENHYVFKNEYFDKREI